MESLNFEELMEQSLKEMKLDKVVTGTVIAITDKGEIIVDLGYKADGIIPKKEYCNEIGEAINDIKIGDKITAEVVKLNDGEGNVLLSYKKVQMKLSRTEFEEKVKNDDIFEEKIIEVLEKGFVTSYKGIRIFIPLSLSGITRDENRQDYKGKIVRFKITEYEPKIKKIIGSVKAVLDMEKERKVKEFWDNVENGKEYDGIVTSISTYGAFVDLGEVQGLLHISEMTWEKNANPRDVLTVGEKIKVIVKAFDKENRRIMLVYKEKGPNPWENIDEKYKIGDIVTVKVVKFMNFGAFVELEYGIEGLVHISQISEKRIAKPEEILKIGQKVNAKIIDLNKEKQKIELSIRELEGTSNEYIEEI